VGLDDRVLDLWIGEKTGITHLPDQPDLSVVVTAHSETVVSGPTMRAAEASVVAAITAGVSVEKIIAFDNATTASRNVFSQYESLGWQCLEINEGDLGRTRNKVIRDHVNGDAVAFLDADDLFSENWLVNGFARLQEARRQGQPRCIIHPELNWLFDGTSSVYWNPDQNDQLFLSRAFYLTNYYDSLCLAPREAHLELPYVHRDIPAGLSFQDWQFSIETMAAGWVHFAAADTIIFKRRRDTSLVTESRARQSIVRDLGAMRIDRIGNLGDPQKTPSIAVTAPAETKLRQLIERARTERPHYGATFQARVERAEARIQQDNTDAEYQLIRDGFDVAYYLAKYPDLMTLERFDFIAHYLNSGAREGRDPSPLFGTRESEARLGLPRDDAAKAFAIWRSGKQPVIGAPFSRFDELSTMFGLSSTALENLWASRYVDLRERLMFGNLGQQVSLAARFEPLVEQSWPEALQVKIPGLHSRALVNRLTTLRDLQLDALDQPARAVILVNRPRWGGARRMEGQIADALVARYGKENVIVISTDDAGEMPQGKFPDGVRHVDFKKRCGDVNPSVHSRLLVQYLRSLGPEVVFNINSRLFWDTLTTYGPALATSMNMFACLLCNEQNAYGHWTGYPMRRFYRHIDILSGVATDSQFLADELAVTYMLTPEYKRKLHVFPGPADADIPPSLPHQNRFERPQVFWAGRLDPQKRVDLVFEIARLMPDVDFRLWGETVSGNPHSWPAKPSNILFEGKYASFAELPLQDADLWLYTSAWDGVPQILLEVAMAAIPVISTNVGGTKEALQSDPKLNLPANAGPDAYAHALRGALRKGNSLRQNALKHRDALLKRRSSNNYALAIDAMIASTSQEQRS